jgi:hypothetical protein
MTAVRNLDLMCMLYVINYEVDEEVMGVLFLNV